jgi:uncharacterized membrane protein
VGGAALVLWCANSVVGCYLLGAWLSHGGRPAPMASRAVFPGALIAAHTLLALAGLALWLGYLETARPGLAWTAFAVVWATALLGFAMLTRWLGKRRGRHARGTGQRFPVTAVALHAVAGLATFILVLLAAGLAGRR